MYLLCVCCHPIYSGRQVSGRTSRGHIGGRSHPSFLYAVLALIFLARIQPFLSLVDHDVEFCVLTISSFSTCWGIWGGGFAKKGYTSLFLSQKGVHLENKKMRQQSRQEDQNATRHKGKPLGFNGRYTVSALTLVADM